MRVSQVVGCAAEHAVGRCFYSLRYVKSSTETHTDTAIWALAQLELDASEATATWSAEAMLSFCIWIGWTYWPKVTVSTSRQPGSAGVCWKVSLNHCHLSVARLLSLNGWWNGAKLCIWEGAALVKRLATTVCTTDTFIPAVLQWELGAAAKNQCCSLPQLPALTSSLLSLVPKKAANTTLNWEG